MMSLQLLGGKTKQRKSLFGDLFCWFYFLVFFVLFPLFQSLFIGKHVNVEELFCKGQLCSVLVV